MKIKLNGMNEAIPDVMTIKALIEWVKEGDPDLIVEQNGMYIYPRDYHSQRVSPGDVIEFINPNLGG